MATLPARRLVVNATPSEPTPFADGWRALHDAGGVPVVVKANTNEAQLKGWQKIGRYKPETLAGLATKHPNANLGVSCGASRITVVDLDTEDLNLMRYVLGELGDTPLIVRTPRGLHLYYATAGEGCGSFSNHPDQAWSRIKGDVKGIGGQVVAPPSVRPGGTYEFLRCATWVPFDELPAIPADHPAMLPFRTGRGVTGRASTTLHSLREAPISRADSGGRNDHLYRRVLEGLAPYNGGPPEQVEARAYAIAHQCIASGEISVVGDHPFTAADIRKAVTKPIEYTVAGRNYHALRGGTRARLQNDMRALSGDADAYMLLAVLRESHCAATFAASPTAMADADVIPTWTTGRYRRARDVLLRCGLLECVHRGGSRKGDASQFRLIGGR